MYFFILDILGVNAFELSALAIAFFTVVALIITLRKGEDIKNMGMLRSTLSDLHALYDKEGKLMTKEDCELYAIKLLDIMSGLAHLNLKNKIREDVLIFLKYDFSVARRIMKWFDDNKLDEKYGDDTKNIWSNLTKYYEKHPEIQMANDDVLPITLLNFDDLDTEVFVYGTLIDNLTRTSILGRQVRVYKADLEGYESVLKMKIEGIMYPVAVPNESKKINGMVLNLTPQEIIKIDEYEGESYKRIKVTLKGDSKVWVYVVNDNMKDSTSDGSVHQ